MTASASPPATVPSPAPATPRATPKAYFEVLAILDGPPHAEGCACQVKTACVRRVMILRARSSPAILELMDA